MEFLPFADGSLLILLPSHGCGFYADRAEHKE